MKILVHVCCAPDAVYFLKRLREDFPQAEICAFFYDPNIHPYEEYRLRLLETERTCHHLGITLYEGEYDLESWMNAVKGLEEEPERGKRCEVCFDYRLQAVCKVCQGDLRYTLYHNPFDEPKKGL
jgi:predicted adenine nucleotide alpha hydrolase (AANH) superfamily ATPase